MKVKISTAIFVLILTFLAPLVPCNASPSDPAEGSIEFVVFPNGTAVDTRISEQVADTVIKHFEAIENGDVMAYRNTVFPAEFGDLIFNARQILETFPNFFDIGQEAMDLFTSRRILNDEFWYQVFHREIPPRAQNKGIFVREIRFDLSFEVMTTVTSNKNEERIYIIVLEENAHGKFLIRARVEHEVFRLHWR